MATEPCHINMYDATLFTSWCFIEVLKPMLRAEARREAPGDSLCDVARTDWSTRMQHHVNSMMYLMKSY